jgi:outer membrane protein assembly factor BamA
MVSHISSSHSVQFRKRLRWLINALPLLGIAFLFGCNPTKRLASDEYLLKKNKFKFEEEPKIDKDDLKEVVKQEPNRKILGARFYLWAYNVPNPEKFEKRNEKRLQKLQKKNGNRLEKGKDPKEFKPFGSWWQETVGEAPVIFDSTLVNKSAEQIRTFLVKHGYFNAEVSSEINTRSRKQMKTAVYLVEPKKPYLIDSLSFNVPGDYLVKLLGESRSVGKSVKVGDRFDIEKLDQERKKHTAYFRNRGYYDFNKELIYFDVDSSLNSHSVHLELGIVPRKVPYEGNPDSLIVKPYKRYKLNEIQVIDRPFLRGKEIFTSDTLILSNYRIIDQNQLKVKPKTISQNILFDQNEYYELDKVTTTYRRLSTLPIVRAASIEFEPVSEDLENRLLNVNISLSPAPKQNFSLEWNGTNQGGFLGISGAVGYRNRNIFGGAEVLSMEISGGLEAQQLLTESGTDPNVGQGLAFNTVEFGPQISLTFPRFLLPFSSDRFAKSANPRTTLITNLSYQRRPDYERTRSFGSILYRWNETATKEWQISPLELSLIKIDRSTAFDDRLAEINDPFLTNSFQDHFIQNSRIAFILNTQRSDNPKSNLYFYRGEIESAGSLLRGLYQLSDGTTNENGGYEALGIQFAQYVKTVHDFRYYNVPNEKMSTAYRVSAGVGIPLQNLGVLPFEKSFFAGGANGIRAWQARTLGPGSFRDPVQNFDKIGDILIEGSIEYRFDITDILEGAFFMDAGNIWIMGNETERPGALFEFDRFLSEIAIGAGAGTRFNFDFFLIRLDLGLQIKDPSLDPGERWLIQTKDKYNAYIDDLNTGDNDIPQLSDYRWQWNLNIGIGYPF